MSRKKSILLSRRNGLNPTIEVCPYCGRDKGILLMGALGDKVARKMGRENGEMPMYTLFEGDYEPCDECAKDNIVVLVLDHEPVKGERPDIVSAFLMLRRHVGMIIQPEGMAERIMKCGKVFVDRDTAARIKGAVAELEKKSGNGKEGPEDDH